MKKTKNTKRALIASALALLVCVSMLVGSTFAWFTDSATSGSNVIQSGTLDIVMEYWDGDSWENAEGQILEFRKGGNYNGVVVHMSYLRYVFATRVISLQKCFSDLTV